MKYTKIPVEIEAIQLTTQNIKQVYEFIHGEGSVNLNCNMAWDYWEIYEKKVEKEGLRLKTLESDNETQIASIGDYVIRGVKGEYYPCKPDIFTLTYSPSDFEVKDREQEEESLRLSILKDVYEESILKFPNETWVNFEDRRLEPSKWLIFECMDRFSKLTPKETEGEEKSTIVALADALMKTEVYSSKLHYPTRASQIIQFLKKEGYSFTRK